MGNGRRVYEESAGAKRNKMECARETLAKCSDEPSGVKRLGNEMIMRFLGTRKRVVRDFVTFQEQCETEQ